MSDITYLCPECGSELMLLRHGKGFHLYVCTNQDEDCGFVVKHYYRRKPDKWFQVKTVEIPISEPKKKRKHDRDEPYESFVVGDISRK